MNYNLALGLLGGTTPMFAVHLIAKTDYLRTSAWYLAAALTSFVGFPVRGAETTKATSECSAGDGG